MRSLLFLVTRGWARARAFTGAVRSTDGVSAPARSRFWFLIQAFLNMAILAIVSGAFVVASISMLMLSAVSIQKLFPLRFTDYKRAAGLSQLLTTFVASIRLEKRFWRFHCAGPSISIGLGQCSTTEVYP